MADHTVIGKIGRVTGTISSNHLGEVMLPIRGGTEAFHAHPSDEGDVFKVGSRVVIVEFYPPRTVIVTGMF